MHKPEPDIGQVDGLITTVEPFQERGEKWFGYRISYTENGELVGYQYSAVKPLALAMRI